MRTFYEPETVLKIIETWINTFAFPTTNFTNDEVEDQSDLFS